MLFPEPSVISNPGRVGGPMLGTCFLLGMEGAAGSDKEPLPGARPLRSGIPFSFSTEDGQEYDKFS